MCVIKLLVFISVCESVQVLLNHSSNLILILILVQSVYLIGCWLSVPADTSMVSMSVQLLRSAGDQ